MAKKGSSRLRHAIVVAGDVTIDWLQWVAGHKGSSNGSSPSNWVLYPGTRMKAEPGGSLLLARMVEAATDTKVITHELANLENIPPEQVLHSISVLDGFASLDSKDTIFRVNKYGGFSGPQAKPLKALPVVGDNGQAGLVVLDDAGNGFREDKAVWPKALLNGGRPIVILKMSRPLAEGELWKQLAEKHAENLIVVISANDLRDMGVSISRRLSWEQTAEDFTWQMANNPKIRSLATCKNLIVRFGLDGAIHYSNVGGKITARLYFDPGYGEDGFKDQHKGDMQGVTAAFVAGIAADVFREGSGGIGKGIRTGITRSRQLFVAGFGKAEEEPAYPVSSIFNKASVDTVGISEVEIPAAEEKASDKKRYWTILEECTRGKLEQISYNAVVKKTENTLNDVPAAKFGGLYTIDRSEIESFQGIKNLMAEYLEKPDVTMPLSIAVFGPPGSGKSFGVTQLAKSIDPRIEKIEFNVAQFTSVDDLVHAFHKVRDTVLSGRIPLVFFDEFDAAFSGELGWLKYFLAPMQDGVFKEGETMHPIGRSIFVFAGGTSFNYQQFSRENLDWHLSGGEKEAILQKFRAAKGTDFISRLRGYVNVLGPNRNGDDDAFYIIRRALLLRSLLKRKVPQIFDDQDNARIDPGVVRAFLKVPAYKHGARSMEAIIDMSMLAGRRTYEQAALPSIKQLELHVNSDIFSKLVLRDVLFHDVVERLAMASHAQYLIEQKGKKKASDPVMRPWGTLPKKFKESSRSQARQIPEKLQRIGLDFMPFLEKPAKRFEFTEREVETLAEMEHERWMAERLKAGWVLGERDPDKNISPYLVPWSELSEDVKDWDRNPVRRIPELLEMAGFEIYQLY